MDPLGLRHPFFRPLWRRCVTVAFCLGWAALEFATANLFWGILFGAIGAAAVWQFFLVPWPEDDESGRD